MTTPGPADDDASVRPWEEPGAVRRDCEPHRGPALLLAARAGLGLAAVSAAVNVGAVLLLGVSPRDPLAAAAGAAGLTLTATAWAWGAAVWRAAAGDLALMRAGRVDPAGRAQALGARFRAAATLALPLVVPAALALLRLLAWAAG
jgi:hypothetical protein